MAPLLDGAMGVVDRLEPLVQQVLGEDRRRTPRGLRRVALQAPSTCAPRPASFLDKRDIAMAHCYDQLDNRLAYRCGVKEVGAFEAKNKFGQLLDWVEAGDEVVITRRGKVVARLVPPVGAISREAGHEVAERIRARRKGVTLGGLKIKDLIAEGRL